MANKTAPPRRLDSVRDVKSGEVRTGVHPIDAKEMVASGHYEYYVEEAPLAELTAHTPPGAGVEGDEDKNVPELPKIAELAAVLVGMTDGDAILAMQAQDTRKTAQPLYEARLAELTAP